MQTIVLKYGGSSVETVDKIHKIAKQVIEKKNEGYRVVVVVSAMGKTTNQLIDIAKQVSNNPCKREIDMLISTGEQVSISLLSIALKAHGYESISLTGLQAGIKTEGHHTKNIIIDINSHKINEYLNGGKIVVIAGFQGVNASGDITTLGRGGSDTTAVAIAAKLNCMCCIYTDVDGIYSVDPRLYPNAKKIYEISYEEMIEMSSLGARVMETRSVEIGYKYKVPIYVASSITNVRGTFIKEYDETMEKNTVTGITTHDQSMMITINHIPYASKNIASIFSLFANEAINIDMISQTSPSNGFVNVSFTTIKEEERLVEGIINELKRKYSSIEVNINKDIIKLSVIGLGMRHHSGVAFKVFQLFADHDIKFHQVTTSEISISYTINESDKQKAIHILVNEFNLRGEI